MVLGCSRNSASGSLGGSLVISNADHVFSKISQVGGNTASMNGTAMSTGVEYDISSVDTITLQIGASSVTSLSATVEIW